MVVLFVDCLFVTFLFVLYGVCMSIVFYLLRDVDVLVLWVLCAGLV